MTETVELAIHEYGRRFSERDVEGLAGISHVPFLAIRQGTAIHLPDLDALREHLAGEISAYRLVSHAGTWTPVEIDLRHLGEDAAFATVHWNASDADGQVVRDTWTSYHLLATPDGWRFLSYTNHF